MKKCLALAFALLPPSVCSAQSIPSMDRRVTLQGPTGLNWAMSTKADANGGSLINPTVVGGKLSDPIITGGTATEQTIANSSISNGTAVGTAVEQAVSAADISGAVSRALSSRQSDRVSVLDFGAKCDGTSDDTAPLQAAINATAKAGVPLQVRGTCISGSLSIPSGTYMEGSLQGATLRIASGSGPWLLNMGSDTSNVVIDHLTFDGTNLNPSLESALIYRAPSTVMGSGIYITNNRFINIPPSGPKQTHAVMLNNVDGAYIYGNRVDQSGGDAVNLNAGYYFVANNRIAHSGDGCVAYNNSARGVVIGNVLSYCNLGVGAGPEGGQTDTDIAQNMSVVGNTFESNFIGVNFGWFSYDGRSAPANWQIVGNTFRNTESVGTEFDGVSNQNLTSGVIAGNTYYGTGSSAYDGQYQAIPVDIRIGSANGINIIGNTISAPRGNGSDQRAIQVGYSQLYTVNGNVISDSGPTHYSRGIALENSQYGSINGNIINNVNIGIIGEGGAGLNYTNISSNNLIGISNMGIVSGDVTSYTSINSNSINGSPTAVGIVIPSKSNTLGIVGNIINVGAGTAIVDNSANWIAGTIRSNTVGKATAPAERTNTSGGNVAN